MADAGSVVTHIDYTVEGRRNGVTHRPSPWRSDFAEVEREHALFAMMNPTAEWVIFRRVRTSTEAPMTVAETREAGGQGE